MEDGVDATVPMSLGAGLSGSLGRKRVTGETAVLRKAAVRVVRDARVHWSHLRVVHRAAIAMLCVAAASLAISIILRLTLGQATQFAIARALGTNQPGHFGMAPLTTQCRCPLGDPSEPPDLLLANSLGKAGHALKDLLSSSSMVGRARVMALGLDPESKPSRSFVRLKWDMLLRGNPRLAELNLVVDLNEALGCHANRDFPEAQQDGYYLILSGNPGTIASNSTLLATPIHCGSVVLLQWSAIAKPYRDMLFHEKAEDKHWWGHIRKDIHNGHLPSTTPLQIEPGLSIFAAARDRTDLLVRALTSWLAIPEVDEVVIIDWGSSVSILSKLHRDLPHAVADPRLYVARVQNQDSWILSRAYNLAASLTTRERIFKADADTLLEPGFFDDNPLQEGQFYAGDWKATTDEDQLHTNGLLYCHRKTFFRVNGYDERIVTYGWDDTDIVKRIQTPDMAHVPFNLAGVRHLNHTNEARVGHQQGARGSLIEAENPFAPSVEVQRNRILSTKMDIVQWGPFSRQILYNAFWRSAADVAVVERVFVPATTQTTLTELVSEENSIDASKRAIRIVLRDRFALTSFASTWHLDFYKGLLDRVTFPEHYRRVVINVTGGCGSRILAFAAAQAAAQRAAIRGKPWHLQVIWKPRPPVCPFQLGELFVLSNAEVFDHVPALVAKEGFERETVESLSSVETEPGSQVFASATCGARIRDDRNRELIRRELSKLLPSAATHASLGQRGGRIFQYAPGALNDTEVIGKFGSAWRGKISARRFSGWRKDTLSVSSEKRELFRVRRTLLEGCAEGSQESQQILEEYPELLTILTGIVSGVHFAP